MSDAAPRWSVVICFFNERDYLPATLAALCTQELQDFQLILVDNASTDGSTEVCREVLRDYAGPAPVYLHETRPGKTNALECGLAHVVTPFVAFCDADTFYPPHYLKLADEIYASAPPSVGAVMAVDLDGPPQRDPRMHKRQMKKLRKARLFQRRALTGGFGHTFRTEILRRVGGFSTKLWPYVFEDHEVMYRFFKIARSRYHYNLWCVPSKRRGDRGVVDWTPFERKLYGLLPYALHHWYFYKFLGPRFAARGFSLLKTRERPWLEKT
jgi:glycosyltransferase involved in cell wall biosynthesis